MKEGLIAAIDCGTQSARVLLFDCKGNLVAKMKSEFEPYVSAHPGWAEQNPEVYFDAICQACNELALSSS
jgi:sugar (pentulose or hexulose) kinase